MKKYAYGYPRLGPNREFKLLTERFWAGKIKESTLLKQLNILNNSRMEAYKCMDGFPLNEFSLYDPMLDTALSLGCYSVDSLSDYYDLCRGKHALEMTKWFNTNYHYLVPVLSKPCSNALIKGNNFIKQVPVPGSLSWAIGPFTFLKLSKGKVTQDMFLSLARTYCNSFYGKQVWLEEPAFVMDLSDKEISLIKEMYTLLCDCCSVKLFTYYDAVDPRLLKVLYSLPFNAIGLDFVDGEENLTSITKFGFPSAIELVAGVISGRNVWRVNWKSVNVLLQYLSTKADNLSISNSCPLYHVPLSTKNEQYYLNKKLLRHLSFADQKLEELQFIGNSFKAKFQKPVEYVSIGLKEVYPTAIPTRTPYAIRKVVQDKLLNLPLFPVTTIGSYPQTKEVRQLRRDFNEGRITKYRYKEAVKKDIKHLIDLQLSKGLDVLVHGEFERTDMVEFFAKQLKGIATTSQGWIISYGTRVYRPPIIHSDVSRVCPMTLDEVLYAQSLTSKPVKGMLTGPITILAWSYVREDRSLSAVAYQIAHALNAEVMDYEKSGIKIVQIDEPAFREKAPLKHADWSDYFIWAVNAFNIACYSKSGTQIHSHMCYSEFNEIMSEIVKLDFDVISIEATRSGGEIVKSFAKVKFEKQIGLGVWDIHSPVPFVWRNAHDLLNNAMKYLKPSQFWVVPDCGLKSRAWSEVLPSLDNLVLLSDYARAHWRNNG